MSAITGVLAWPYPWGANGGKSWTPVNGATCLYDTKTRLPQILISKRLYQTAKSWNLKNQLGKLQSVPACAEGGARFAVIGDTEPGRFLFSRLLWGRPGVAKTLIRNIQKERIEFSVQLGDMVSCGTEQHYGNFFEKLSSLKPSAPYLSVLGNHDRRYPHGVADAALYEELLAPANHYFDRGLCRFIFVDTTAGGVNAAQIEWLNRALNTTLTKIVFIHIPPMQVKSLLPWGRGGFIKGSEDFVNLMSDCRVARVYMGHVHGFGISEYQGVRYVLSGGGGSPLYPSPLQRFYHFITVDASPEGVHETVHCLDGKSFYLA
ncbi:MAG: metallophosphoesterase [Elusimicrobia bacterium]|nr:metallophosphoesterase [Elusimicrobiota bacterium]